LVGWAEAVEAVAEPPFAKLRVNRTPNEEPQAQNQHLGHASEKQEPRLAFHLNLQDFSRQARHSGAWRGGSAVRVKGIAFLIVGSTFRIHGNAILFGSGLAVGRHSFNLDAELAFELKEIGALFPQEKSGSDAAFPGAACAADAMDEVFGDVGKIIVDDVGDVLNVDAASGDVGGHEDSILPALEAGQGGGALRLRAVAMNHGGVDALAVQALGDAFGAALGAREDKAAAAFVVEQVVEHVRFAVFGNFESLKTNIFGRLGSGAEREADGILGVVAYELRHGAFHGGGEAESLALAWQNTNNTADSREEAHVEHAVGFIEDECLDAAQRDEPAIEIIFEAAGSGDDEARTLADGVELPAFRQTTDDESRRLRLLCAQGVILRDDLHREFPGRHKNQSRDSGSMRLPQLLHDGKKERERFAGSCLGRGDNVLAFQGLRNCCRLHGSWRRKFRRDESLLQRRR